MAESKNASVKFHALLDEHLLVLGSIGVLPANPPPPHSRLARHPIWSIHVNFLAYAIKRHAIADDIRVVYGIFTGKYPVALLFKWSINYITHPCDLRKGPRLMQGTAHQQWREQNEGETMYRGFFKHGLTRPDGVHGIAMQLK